MSDDIQAMEEVPVEPVAEHEETQNTEHTETEAPKHEEEAPIPKGVQKRIDRAVRRQYEAEAREKVLREQLEQRIQPQQQQTQQEPEAPKLEDFKTYEDFLKAQARFEAKQEITQTLTEHNKRLDMERAQTAQRQTVESWTKKVEKATAELPDFADVVGSSSAPMPEHVKAMVLNSDEGPRLAYYLAQHPDEAEQIASQHPLAAIRALVRIEDKLVAEKSANKATDTPAPKEPSGSKAKSDKSPNEMTDKEFADWRRKTINKRR